MQASRFWFIATGLALGMVLSNNGASAQQPPQRFTVGPALDFKPGSAKARAILSRIPDVRELVAERFVVASVDLDDDGRNEIVVKSESGSFCGSAGCSVSVLAQRGNKVVTIGSFYSAGSLAVTNEKVRGYRALASIDENGAIEVLNKRGDAMHGKPVVFVMTVAAPPGASAEPASASPPAAQAPSAAPEPTAGDERAASVLGIRLGMPAAQAEALVRKHAATYNGVMQVNKYVFKAQCAGCPPYEFQIAAGHGVGNRAPGNIAKESVIVNLSPPSEGARVISVSRTASMKAQIARDALVGQFVERHGKPGFDEPHRVVWYLDAREVTSVPRNVKYPSGMGAFLCSRDPESPSSLLKQVMGSSDEYRRTGVSEPLHVGCGTVLTLDMSQSGPGYVSYFHTVLIDHRAFGNAAVAANDMLLAQQNITDGKTRKEVRGRAAPKLD